MTDGTLQDELRRVAQYQLASVSRYTLDAAHRLDFYEKTITGLLGEESAKALFLECSVRDGA